MKNLVGRARGLSAILLVAAFIIALVPRPAGAGACDEPGWIGGGCLHSGDQPIAGTPPDKNPPRPRHHHNDPLRYLQSWLLAFLTGVVR